MFGYTQEFSKVKALKVNNPKKQYMPVDSVHTIPTEDAKLLAEAKKVEILKEGVKHPNPSFNPDNLK